METCGFLYFASFYSLSVCPMCEWIHKCVFAMITITTPHPPPFSKHTRNRTGTTLLGGFAYKRENTGPLRACWW